MANEIRDFLNGIGGVRKDWRADFKDTGAVRVEWKLDHRRLAIPANTVVPAVPSGTKTNGSTLTADNGTWTGGDITFTYQWIRGAATTIVGATSKTYVLQGADVGQTIKCAVTATNNVGSPAAVNSTATAAIT